MFGRHITLFRLLGFPIRVDASWLLLAAPIGWTLADGYFPALAPEAPGPVHWLMALAALVGLMASLVLHEFAHSVVARRHGMPIQAITLFLFGGVAEMEDEPATPRGEFRMALAGPAMSVLIGAVMFAGGVAWTAAGGSPDDPVALVAGYLALVNGLLAAFNLIPAFPLDGGRVLRAVLWGWRGDVLWATRVAGGVGWLFGLALASVGAVSVVQGGMLAGFWWILLGFFVYAAARGAVAQQRTRLLLAAEPLSRFLRAPPPAVDPAMPVAHVVERKLLDHPRATCPVVEDGRLVGAVSGDSLRGRGAGRRVAEVMHRLTEDHVIPLDFATQRALARMRRVGRGRLMVVEDGRLVGVVVLGDILRFVAQRLDPKKCA